MIVCLLYLLYLFVSGG